VDELTPQELCISAEKLFFSEWGNKTGREKFSSGCTKSNAKKGGAQR